MHIESPLTTVPKSAREVFEFLTDVANFEKLMPENISKFEVLEQDKFVFALKGMPEIILKMKEKNPFPGHHSFFQLQTPALPSGSPLST